MEQNILLALTLQKMNEILKKVVLELANDKPNIAYVRGMLETLLSINMPTIVPTTAPTFTVPTPPASIDPEDAALAEEARKVADLMSKIPPSDDSL